MGIDNAADGAGRVSPQYTVFRCQNNTFAIEIDNVQEIISNPPLTRVPNVNPYIQGVFNLRGKIYSVVQLKRLFNISDNSAVDDPVVIIAGSAGESIGLTVDEVKEMATITKSEISASEAEIPAPFREYIAGFCDREDGRIYIIDISRISGKDPGKN